MNQAQQDEISSLSIGEMRESLADGPEPLQVSIANLAGILASPFARPYPTQRPGSRPAPGTAGELRGYYRRSDGADRWKPSWSGFDHPRSGTTHKGVDIYAPVGTDVVAIADGYAMLYPNPAPGDELGVKVGLTITGSDGTKYDVLYGHLSALNGVSRSVKKGDILGQTGCTGNANDGACSTANACGGYSSHLHVAVRESRSGAPYLDPASTFDWTLAHAEDKRDVPCSQAFAAGLLRHWEYHNDSMADPSDRSAMAPHAGPSKRYKLAFFSDLNASEGEATGVIFENLLITLSIMAAGPYPGVRVSIRGRERLFFHPSLSPHSTLAITAAFQNIDGTAQQTGTPVRVKLVRIEGQSIGDTGLRRMAVETFVQGATLDLDQPVTFLGETLEEE